MRNKLPLAKARGIFFLARFGYGFLGQWPKGFPARNKRGLSGILLVVLVGGLLVIAGALVFLNKVARKDISLSSGRANNVSSSATVLPALSKGDSINDLENDVNSTKFDDVDRDLNDASGNLNF